jgi:hypothetical protein
MLELYPPNIKLIIITVLLISNAMYKYFELRIFCLTVFLNHLELILVLKTHFCNSFSTKSKKSHRPTQSLIEVLFAPKKT